MHRVEIPWPANGLTVSCREVSRGEVYMIVITKSITSSRTVRFPNRFCPGAEILGLIFTVHPSLYVTVHVVLNRSECLHYSYCAYIVPTHPFLDPIKQNPLELPG